MTIRSLHPSDLEEIKRLHTLYFGHEFNLPEFMKFVCAFIVEDEEGIILAGGIRDIAECVAVTNLSRDPRDRMKALNQLTDASVFVCQKSGYDQIYLWSGNAKWSKRLQKMGCRLPQGQSLILDL